LKPFKEVYNLLEEFKDHCNPDFQPQQLLQQTPSKSNDKLAHRSPDTSMDQSVIIKPYD